MLESKQADHHATASIETQFPAAVRRADWRFLLPDPNLNDVLYVGALPEDLLAALRLLSHSLAPADAINTADEVRPADLVVLRSPTRAQTRLALGLLKARGAVYCELYRPLRRPLSFLRDQAGAVHQELTRAGFRSIQVHWHYPSFKACTKLIPITDPAALAYWIASGNRTWLAQPAWLRLLTGPRLLERVLPCVSIIAQRGER